MKKQIRTLLNDIVTNSESLQSSQLQLSTLSATKCEQDKLLIEVKSQVINYKSELGNIIIIILIIVIIIIIIIILAEVIRERDGQMHAIAKLTTIKAGNSTTTITTTTIITTTTTTTTITTTTAITTNY